MMSATGQKLAFGIRYEIDALDMHYFERQTDCLQAPCGFRPPFGVILWAAWCRLSERD